MSENRKWPWTTKTGHKIIIEAPTFRIAKSVLIEIPKPLKK